MKILYKIRDESEQIIGGTKIFCYPQNFVISLCPEANTKVQNEKILFEIEKKKDQSDKSFVITQILFPMSVSCKLQMA